MNIQELIESEHSWTTTMGKAFPNERVVFRGKDLHRDLKHHSWFEVFLYGITGRFFTGKQLKMLNYIWVSTSYPDPRIWNNRVAALAGTARSTGPLALSAAIAVSEADVYGGRPFKKGILFFIQALQVTKNGKSLEDFIDAILSDGKKIYCYGRAMVKGDERVPHMLQFIKELNMDQGPCVRLAIEVERLLQEKKNISMNISALYCSLAVDMGLNPDEFYMFMSLVFVAGMPPCYIEASQKPAGAFFPIRCDNLIYEGKKPRRRVTPKARETMMPQSPESVQTAETINS